MYSRNQNREYAHLLHLLDNDALRKLEEMSFMTYDQKEMNITARLRREYLKIDTMFTFDSGESLDFKKANQLQKILRALSNAIENEEYDREVLMQIIVLIDIVLGCEVSFYRALNELVSLKMIDFGLKKLLTVSFEELYQILSYGNNKRRPR